MDIRNADNILLKNAVINVLDTENSEIILSEKEIDLEDNVVRDFLYNIILKTLADEKNIKARFHQETELSRSFEQSIDGDFLEVTEIISKHFFNMISKTNEKPLDLLFVRFGVGEITAFCMMVLDYNMTYIHKVNVDEDGLNVSIVRQEIALPNASKKPKRAVFYSGINLAEPYLIVLDKLKQEDGSSNFMLSSFLAAEHKYDYIEKTRSIRTVIEEYTRKNLKDDYEDASNLRSSVDESFFSRGIVSPDEIIDNAKLKSATHTHNLKELIETKGFDNSEKFEIDKKYVTKKMTNKVVTTDTGVTIRANREMFNNDEYIETQYNSDGTVNYIIKNVRYTRER